MVNFINKLAPHNDTVIALTPAVASLILMYCWVMSMGIATSSGLGII